MEGLAVGISARATIAPAVSAATTTTASVTPTAAAAAATSATTVFTFASFTDFQRTALDVLALQSVEGGLGGFRIRKSHESEPARPTGSPVGNQIHVRDSAKSLEGILEVIFGSIVGEVSHVQFRIHSLLYRLPSGPKRARFLGPWEDRGIYHLAERALPVPLCVHNGTFGQGCKPYRGQDFWVFQSTINESRNAIVTLRLGSIPARRSG
jgi:hypothetical protein